MFGTEKIFDIKFDDFNVKNVRFIVMLSKIGAYSIFTKKIMISSPDSNFDSEL